MANYGYCPVCLTALVRQQQTCGSRECQHEWKGWSNESRIRRKRYAALDLHQRLQYDQDTAARLKPDPNYVPSLDVEPEKMDYMELLTPKAKVEVVADPLPPSSLQPSDNRTIKDEKEARRLRNLAFLETIEKK